MANYYSYNTNQVQADINMDNAIKDIQNQLLNIPTDTQLGLKANQTDLDITNANVSANTSQLAEKALQSDLNTTNTNVTANTTSITNLTNTKVDYPILSWEYVSSVTIVTNQKYPYGNVLRYGAIPDDNTDNAPILQKVFDQCSLNGQEIHFPIGAFKIRSSIILRECFSGSPTRAYKITGENTEFSAYSRLSPKCYLDCSADLFVNDGVAHFPSISIDMRGMFIWFRSTTQYTVFKNMRLRGAYFARNRVDNPLYWLKGSVEEMSTIENNIFYSIKKNFIGENDNATTSTFYTCSDSIIRNNYIDADPTQNAEMINVYNYDVDMIMEDNFIDYFAYLFTPALTNAQVNLGVFRKNTVNRCFRMSKGIINYGIFNNNIVEFCKNGTLTGAFTNQTTTMQTGKWGAFILDENSADTIINLIMYDNIGYQNDSLLYFVSTSVNPKYVQTQLVEKGSVNGNITFQQQNNVNAFSNTKIQSLDYVTDNTYTTISATVNSNTIWTAYESQHKWINGNLFIAHLVSGSPAFKQYTLA